MAQNVKPGGLGVSPTVRRTVHPFQSRESSNRLEVQPFRTKGEQPMKAILAAAPVAILLAACASTADRMSNVLPAGSTAYWVGTSSSYDSFNHDNVVCSTNARKWGNLPMD